MSSRIKISLQYFYKTWSSVNNMLHVHSNTSISLINFTYTLPLAISPSVSLLGGKSVDFRSSSVLSFILNGSFLFLLRLSKTHKKHISARYLIQKIQRIKTKKVFKNEWSYQPVSFGRMSYQLWSIRFQCPHYPTLNSLELTWSEWTQQKRSLWQWALLPLLPKRFPVRSSVVTW